MPWTEITRRDYARKSRRYASDSTDEEWAVVARFMPSRSKVGRSRVTDMRTVWDAIQTWQGQDASGKSSGSAQVWFTWGLPQMTFCAERRVGFQDFEFRAVTLYVVSGCQEQDAGRLGLIETGVRDLVEARLAG